MPRLLWLLASSWRNSGREGKSAASCLLDAQGLVVVLLRLLETARGIQQTAPAVVALARSWRNSGRVGKSVRQLLLEAHGLVVVLLRLLEPARRTQQIAPVDVAIGQFLAELGSGGEVGR